MLRPYICAPHSPTAQPVEPLHATAPCAFAQGERRHAQMNDEHEVNAKRMTNDECVLYIMLIFNVLCATFVIRHSSLKIVHQPQAIAKRAIEGVAAAGVEDVVQKFDGARKSVGEIVAIAHTDVHGGLRLYDISIGAAIDDGGVIIGIGEVHFEVFAFGMQVELRQKGGFRGAYAHKSARAEYMRGGVERGAVDEHIRYARADGYHIENAIAYIGRELKKQGARQAHRII